CRRRCRTGWRTSSFWRSRERPNRLPGRRLFGYPASTPERRLLVGRGHRLRSVGGLLQQFGGGAHALDAGALDFPAAERADANQEGGAKFFFARRREQAGGVQRAAAAVWGAASAPGFERGDRERVVAGDRLMRGEHGLRAVESFGRTVKDGEGTGFHGAGRGAGVFMKLEVARAHRRPAWRSVASSSNTGPRMRSRRAASSQGAAGSTGWR